MEHYFHKKGHLANLSHVNSILKMKYEVTDKNFSFYIQFFYTRLEFSQNTISFQLATHHFNKQCDFRVIAEIVYGVCNTYSKYVVYCYTVELPIIIKGAPGKQKIMNLSLSERL